MGWFRGEVGKAQRGDFTVIKKKKVSDFTDRELLEAIWSDVQALKR
jgi:hypothetical protein